MSIFFRFVAGDVCPHEKPAIARRGVGGATGRFKKTKIKCTNHHVRAATQQKSVAWCKKSDYSTAKAKTHYRVREGWREGGRKAGNQVAPSHNGYIGRTPLTYNPNPHDTCKASAVYVQTE